MKNAFEYSERPRFYYDHGNLTVNVMKVESTETFSVVFRPYCTLGRKVNKPHENCVFMGKLIQMQWFLKCNGRVVMKAFHLIFNR